MEILDLEKIQDFFDNIHFQENYAFNEEKYTNKKVLNFDFTPNKAALNHIFKLLW